MIAGRLRDRVKEESVHQIRPSPYGYDRERDKSGPTAHTLSKLQPRRSELGNLPDVPVHFVQIPAHGLRRDRSAPVEDIAM